jgi:hypothetical protein
MDNELLLVYQFGQFFGEIIKLRLEAIHRVVVALLGDDLLHMLTRLLNMVLPSVELAGEVVERVKLFIPRECGSEALHRLREGEAALRDAIEALHPRLVEEEALVEARLDEEVMVGEHLLERLQLGELEFHGRVVLFYYVIGYVEELFIYLILVIHSS